MNRRRLIPGVSLMLLAAACIVGCSSKEEPTSVAQAPAPPPSSQSAQPAASSGESYGGESYGGGSYGGGSSSGGRGGSGYGGGYEDDYGAGYDGGSGYSGYGPPPAGYRPPGEGVGQGMGYQDDYGSGYNGGEPGYDDYGSGYGGMGEYGGGMSGYGQGSMAANGQPNMGMLMQFVNQNCGMCHMGRNSRGEISLVGLSNNFDDPHNIELLQSVMEVLEAGAMPPENRPRPNPQQQEQVVAFIKQSLEGKTGLDRDLLASAQSAFARGREQQALDFLFAHIVAGSPEESAAILAQTRWFPASPRPATTVRLATGVVLTADSSITDVKPIGTSQMGGGGGGSGYGAYGGESIGSRGGPAAQEKQWTFQALTGDFGAELVAAFESRWASGDLGTVFNDVAEAAPAATAATAGGGYSGGGYSGGPGMLSQGSSGYGGGDYGGDYYGGESEYGYGDEYGGGPGGAAATSGRGNTLPGKSLTPGLLYLGTGSQSELLAKAAQAGVDGLFVFEVDVSQNRRRLINNETKLKLLTMDGKTMTATRTLRNTDVEAAKIRGLGDDEVKKNIERLFKSFDESLKLTSLPGLQPQHAKLRMAQLLSDQQTSPLSKLFEAKLFHSMDLLSDDELSMVYQIVLEGNEGESLARGTEDDKKFVMLNALENLAE